MNATAKLAAHHLLRTKNDSGDPLELLTRKFTDQQAETLKKLGVAEQAIAALQNETHTFAQKLARSGGSDDIVTKSLGQIFVEDENVKGCWRQPVEGRCGPEVIENDPDFADDRRCRFGWRCH